MKIEIPDEIKSNFYKWKIITGFNNIEEYFQDALLSIDSNSIYKKLMKDDGIYFIRDFNDYDWYFYRNKIGFQNRFGSRFEKFIKDVETLYENRNQ